MSITKSITKNKIMNSRNYTRICDGPYYQDRSNWNFNNQSIMFSPLLYINFKRGVRENYELIITKYDFSRTNYGRCIDVRCGDTVWVVALNLLTGVLSVQRDIIERILIHGVIGSNKIREYVLRRFGTIDYGYHYREAFFSTRKEAEVALSRCPLVVRNLNISIHYNTELKF